MDIQHINWYPGHMKKTRDLIQENLKLVDTVLEVLDARIPMSSRNPVIDELVRGKRRVILLNKSDLADAAENAKWAEKLRSAATETLLLNSMSGEGLKALKGTLAAIQEERNALSVRKRPLRILIAGVPNVGKSSLINRMVGKRSAKIGDKPGVTRGKQWLGLENSMQLLDTPGILWPKFEDPQAGLYLAFCGSIKDEIMDTESLALELIKSILANYPRFLAARYKLGEADLPQDGDFTGEAALQTMEAIARKRGFILPGKRIDYMRTAVALLDEFRGGLIGRITLEKASGGGRAR
ncbi:MAG: ribosome biogenesis GTPase YlqF [Clostridiales Family XIII bacterium]|jgi:ribosome biogenesis GTPase A|nr:ribosome biogenesis GTPase YlqF [Clostridiales Family XIII bacterium]